MADLRTTIGSFTNSIGALGTALIPGALTAFTGLLPVLGAIYFAASLFLGYTAAVLAFSQNVSWKRRLLALPFVLGMLACAYLAFAEWRNVHPPLLVTLKIDKRIQSGFLYHFDIVNDGTQDLTIIMTKQDVADNSTGSLSSVQPRD